MGKCRDRSGLTQNEGEQSKDDDVHYSKEDIDYSAGQRSGKRGEASFHEGREGQPGPSQRHQLVLPLGKL